MSPRELPPALVAAQATNKKISEYTGYKISPGLIKYINQFRKKAKETSPDEKDFVEINKKIIYFFEEYLNKVGKEKVISEILKLAEDIKKERQMIKCSERTSSQSKKYQDQTFQNNNHAETDETFHNDNNLNETFQNENDFIETNKKIQIFYEQQFKKVGKSMVIKEIEKLLLMVKLSNL